MNNSSSPTMKSTNVCIGCWLHLQHFAHIGNIQDACIHTCFGVNAGMGVVLKQRGETAFLLLQQMLLLRMTQNWLGYELVKNSKSFQKEHYGSIHCVQSVLVCIIKKRYCISKKDILSQTIWWKYNLKNTCHIVYTLWQHNLSLTVNVLLHIMWICLK